MSDIRHTKIKGQWLTMRTMLLVLCGAMMIGNMYLIFMWVPTAGLSSGFHAQRIFYIHVPLAWVGFLAFLFVLAGSIGYLWKKDYRWDALGHSAAEIGVLFTTLVLISGVIWMKPVWGRWWLWEPRLTTTLILWLIYVAYLMIRAYSSNPLQAARYSAILGIVGFVDVPIVYFAVQMWRGIHPGPVIGPNAAPSSLEESMSTTLLFSVVTFTVLFAFLMRERWSLIWREYVVKNSVRNTAFSKHRLDENFSLGDS